MYTSRCMLVKPRIGGKRDTRLLELMVVCTKNCSSENKDSRSTLRF